VRLADPDPEVRAYYLGKLMRQAKPDDVFTFVTLREIKALFPLAARRDTDAVVIDLVADPTPIAELAAVYHFSFAIS
jgi:hypothetical protein